VAGNYDVNVDLDACENYAASVAKNSAGDGHPCIMRRARAWPTNRGVCFSYLHMRLFGVKGQETSRLERPSFLITVAGCADPFLLSVSILRRVSLPILLSVREK